MGTTFQFSMKMSALEQPVPVVPRTKTLRQNRENPLDDSLSKLLDRVDSLNFAPVDLFEKEEAPLNAVFDKEGSQISSIRSNSDSNED